MITKETIPIRTTDKVFLNFKLASSVMMPAYKKGLEYRLVSEVLCPKKIIGTHIAVRTEGAVYFSSCFVFNPNVIGMDFIKNRYRQPKVIIVINKIRASILIFITFSFSADIKSRKHTNHSS